MAWGNACLGGQLPLEELDAWWPRTRYVRALSFCDGAHVTTAAAWLSTRREQGATRLVLDTSGPVGCERVLVVCRESPDSAWRQRWNRVAGATEPPWFDAAFSREATPATLPPAGRTPDDVLGTLTSALEGLVALSERADLAQWGSYFAHVLAVAGGEVIPGDSPLPPTAPATAHRLARAANLADVFGGMGSWNDFVPLSDSAAENERLRCSSLLHESVCAALVATAHA